MTTIKLAWDYTDAEALAALKEFHVYRLDAAAVRIAGSLLTTTTIPTTAAPLVVPANSYSMTNYQIVPVDKLGNEGTAETIGFSASNPLPKVTNLRVIG